MHTFPETVLNATWVVAIGLNPLLKTSIIEGSSMLSRERLNGSVSEKKTGKQSGSSYRSLDVVSLKVT